MTSIVTQIRERIRRLRQRQRQMDREGKEKLCYFFSSLSLFGNKQTDPNRYSIFLLYFILFQNLLLTRNVTNDTLSQKIDVKVYHCLCLAAGRKYEQINSLNQITTNSTKHKNI